MIRHIVAIDNRRGFAKDGVIPWKLPTDEQYFTSQTKKYGGIVLMGRKTFDSIRTPLKGRENFVWTRNQDFQADGVTPVYDLDPFLSQHENIWVIGGRALFEETIDVADELYITEIEADFNCDTFYPMYDSFELAETSETILENGLKYTFRIYKSRTP